MWVRPKGRIQDEFIGKLFEIGSGCVRTASQFMVASKSVHTSARRKIYSKRKQAIFASFRLSADMDYFAGLDGKVEYATLLSDGGDVGLRSDKGLLSILLPAFRLMK